MLGLASIIIGEALFGKRTMRRHLLSVILGAVLYRILITYAFQLGLPASDLKLFSAAIVIIAISAPMVKPYFEKRRKRHVRVRG